MDSVFAHVTKCIFEEIYYVSQCSKAFFVAFSLTYYMPQKTGQEQAEEPPQGFASYSGQLKRAVSFVIGFKDITYFNNDIL